LSVFYSFAVDGNRFQEFIGEIARKYKNKLFILDNAQIHKTQTIKDLVRDTGNEILYTLPYSPRLNPIEQFFNQMKFYMKIRKAMTLEKLKESVKDAIDKVKTENYQNYFLYAYDRKQLERKEISTKHRTLKLYKKNK
jgi:transposase